MSSASTKRVRFDEQDDMPSLDAARFRKRGRGLHTGRRLELSLAGIRKAAGKTQAEVAESSGMLQSVVSRLETQDDMMFSTLKRYAEALGASVAICFELPNGVRIVLKNDPGLE